MIMKLDIGYIVMQVYEYESRSNSVDLSEEHELARFTVLYTKLSTRKHKKWEGDGILVCYVNQAVLISEDGKSVISRSTTIKNINDLENGKEFKMGSWEVQIQERVATNFHVLESTELAGRGQSTSGDCDITESYEDRLPQIAITERTSTVEAVGKGGILCKSFRKKFRCPLSDNSDFLTEEPPFIINEDRVRQFGERAVVADPLVSKYLRSHQKEGVRFIFSAIMKGHGVILADEMGLGKSVQTIVATMALLRQETHSAQNVVRKCLLVVPSSLINNWKCEFRKWFEKGGIPVITVKQVSDIGTYASSFITYPYLIISYEMALRYCANLASVRFDILVCDEAHRLKNINTKLRQALNSLVTTCRVLLTGTPIQNDIEEFFSLLNFVHPTVFNSVTDFKTMCHNEDESLKAKLSDCFLRRMSNINNLYLPDKSHYILFCAPSALQKSILAALCAFISEEPLILIDMMKKVSNHPAVLFKKISFAHNKNVSVDYLPLLNAFPEGYGNRPINLADSGKLSAFVEMMACFRKMKECVLVVSNYTKTLDMLSSLCCALGFCILRLDGRTPISTRQEIVKRFNTEGNPENVFLLSTKAGGVGLNLIGASRLILFDSDWNPATDMQAMARIWRDGQEKACHIYRLVTAGTVDEKILQRQVRKTGLNSVISPSGQSFENSWLDKDFESIFTLTDTQCETHELLGCACDGRGNLASEIDDGTDVHNEDGAPFCLVEGQVCEENCEESSSLHNDVIDGDESLFMSELFRWRHYSPYHTKSWTYFKSIAGFSDLPLNDLTFAFHLSSKF